MTSQQLHEAVDLLLAQYLLVNPGALPSRTSVLELLTWSWQRIQAETAAKQRQD